MGLFLVHKFTHIFGTHTRTPLPPSKQSNTEPLCQPPPPPPLFLYSHQRPGLEKADASSLLRHACRKEGWCTKLAYDLPSDVLQQYTRWGNKVIAVCWVGDRGGLDGGGIVATGARETSSVVSCFLREATPSDSFNPGLTMVPNFNLLDQIRRFQQVCGRMCLAGPGGWVRVRCIGRRRLAWLEWGPGVGLASGLGMGSEGQRGDGGGFRGCCMIGLCQGETPLKQLRSRRSFRVPFRRCAVTTPVEFCNSGALRGRRWSGCGPGG